MSLKKKIRIPSIWGEAGVSRCCWETEVISCKACKGFCISFKVQRESIKAVNRGDVLSDTF